MINKPINMAFDAEGRLWVSSTVEYPYAAEARTAGWTPRARHVRRQPRRDQDPGGVPMAMVGPTRSSDFADELNIPTGVVPWHKPEHQAGCIAWSIPNIWYFADTDGDGNADLREVLFGPLGYEKDTHGMCSSFRLGLGWLGVCDAWVQQHLSLRGFAGVGDGRSKIGPDATQQIPISHLPSSSPGQN